MNTLENIKFDRSYWPKTGTQIPFTPTPAYDLKELWSDFADQATVFVAEALLEESHQSWIEDDLNVVTCVWDVGGDTITIEWPLPDLILKYCSDYGDCVRSDGQADDVRLSIANLEKLESVIATRKKSLSNILSAWKEVCDAGSTG